MGELVGRVLYEARHPTPTGASSATQQRPARRVEIQLRSRDGVVRETTSADEEGRFRLDRVHPDDFVAIVSRVGLNDPDGLAVCQDPEGQRLHQWVGSVAEVREGAVVLPDSAPGLAGPFHILDTLVSGRDAARAWLETPMPPLFVYWGQGETESWSYYHGEVPPGSGRFGIELLAGRAGHSLSDDTDEHDESIILHEYGHFIMDQISTDSSFGGRHPPGSLVDPGLAYEEGRASWFSAMVLRQPWYFDTIGREPGGRLRVAHNLERGYPGPGGLGSEQEVAEILWDLADGVDGLTDEDQDGLALGPARILRAMAQMRAVPGAYPAISTFLQHLRDHEGVDARSLEALLRRGGYSRSMLHERWPPDLPIGGSVAGKIDGVSQPAPSGGDNRADTGIDATRAYRIYLETAGVLSLSLRIFGSGRISDREDLDLEVRDRRADLLARAATEQPLEQLRLQLEAGWYVVYVRDGGHGNHAGFELSTALIPLSAQDPEGKP